MAYTDDGVLAKLSALNETQESIVTVAQWVMFHRRHAEKTVQLWFQRLKDSGANKRLNLIYLANEVAQQSKVRRKTDFLIAFSPIITEATAIAYRGATNEVQQKLRRVVEVWRQRQIFEVPIQDAIEARINELDKSRSAGKKPLFGGGLSSASAAAVPPEIQPLLPLQVALSKLAPGKASALDVARSEYDKITDPTAQVPTPPVHAARLSGLLKTLASAEGAVAQSIKAREALIGGLEKILNKNRTALENEQSEHLELNTRKTRIENKKREVEDGIMRGLAEESTSAGVEGGSKADGDFPPSASVEPERPAVEALSPPSVEALTPTNTPPPEPALLLPTDTGAALMGNAPPSLPPFPLPSPGADLLSSLTMPRTSTTTTSGPTMNGSSSTSSAKKRKLTHDDDDEDNGFAPFGNGDALDGLDADVAEMLRQESAPYQRL